MKFFPAYLCGVLFFLTMYADDTTTFDGSSAVKYAGQHRIMRNQSTTVRGFVDFNNGFTVNTDFSRGSEVLMDTNVSVSGVIDLRGTNTLTLLRNLYLDGGVTLSSGRIKSHGNALVMKGDLTIPADAVVHCGGNLIIDGNGHTLHMGSSSQIFLDNSSTLTLRNMIIQTTHSYPGQPSLNISSSMSKLALDNVVLSLGDDLHIPRGQLFFHNDVVVTGTSALVYRSIAPSYIASHGTLMFDNGTTFSYAPATDNKDLIVLSDASSTLAFDGSSLLATHTGLRLTKGRLYLDDKVTLNSQSDQIINATTSISLTTSAYTGTGSGPISCSWSPDGKYVAVINSNKNILKIFAFSQGASPLIGTTPVASIATGTYPFGCSWSSNGRYLAVVNRGSNTLQIFCFSGGLLMQIGSTVSTSSLPISCSWSPDGKYIAISHEDSTTFKVFSFLGGTPILWGSIETDTNQRQCSWSPEGKYVAVVCAGAHKLYVFALSGGALRSAGSVATGNSPYSCSWSPDGKYIVVSNYEATTIQVFSFADGTLTSKGSVLSGSNSWSCSCSPDGKYVAAANVIENKCRIFAFNGRVAPYSVGGAVGTGTHPRMSLWSPDGRYVAVVSDGSNLLEIFSVNYRPDTSVQPVERSIVFGNSALDSTYDLDVHVLSGARVEVTGNVYHDPA